MGGGGVRGDQEGGGRALGVKPGPMGGGGGRGGGEILHRKSLPPRRKWR